MTPEMKYVKWPSKSKVAKEMVSVILTSILLSMLIAAGDQFGMFILNGLMELFL